MGDLKIYLSYPYRDAPTKRVEEVRKLARRMVAENPSRILLIPHLAFFNFEEEFGREYAMKCSKQLLSSADVLCLGIQRNDSLSEGMKEELEHAMAIGLDYVYLEDLQAYESRPRTGAKRKDPPIDDRVFEFMKVEYREAGEFYRHNYATVWQSGSILIASAFVVLGFLIQSSQIETLLTVVPIAMLAFWWLGIFEPMNRYGDWRLVRGSEIEARLRDSPEFQRSGPYEPLLFRGISEARTRPPNPARNWRPLPYRVRSAVRIALPAIIAVLVLAMTGILRANPSAALVALIVVFLLVFALLSAWGLCLRKRSTRQ